MSFRPKGEIPLNLHPNRLSLANTQVENTFVPANSVLSVLDQGFLTPVGRSKPVLSEAEG